MNCARAAIGITAGAFRLFHFGPHGVQVVGRRDYGEKQNKSAAQRSYEDERAPASSRTVQNSPLPPQEKGGQQQREPAEVKKKLHTKRPSLSEEAQPIKLVQLPQDNQDSIATASDLRTRRVLAPQGKSPLRALENHQGLRRLQPLAQNGFFLGYFGDRIGMHHI